MDRHTRRPHRKRQSLVFGGYRHDRLRANWFNQLSYIGSFMPAIHDREWPRRASLSGALLQAVQLLRSVRGDVDVRAALHRRSVSPSRRCEAHQPEENVMNFLATRTAATRLTAG